MDKVTIFLTVLCAMPSFAAPATSLDQVSGASQHHSKKTRDEVTARGCVSRYSTDYILIQPDEGNSYELQESQKVKLAPYLGHEVELTGMESPSMSNSSDAGFGRTGSPSPVTITVYSINSIAKRCTEY
jgi:hypothetical protein